MSRQPKCFIFEANSYDYSPLEAWGELVVLKGNQFAGGIDDVYNPDIVHSLVEQQMSDYIPGFDWLVPTGDPQRMIAIAHTLGKKYGVNYKSLKWDARAYRYIPIIVKAA